MSEDHHRATDGDLTPLELACGVPIGIDAAAPSLPTTAMQPLEAFEQAVLRALLRPPCVVSFSGGRDSSAVLAAATSVARREGLALPVPVTARFPGTVRTQESEWQECVVEHLQLRDWQCLEFSHELDLIGPVSGPILERHGLQWPPNTYFHLPILEQAQGGSVLTGIDGDGLLGSWRWQRAANVLARRSRPRPRDLLSVGLAWSPPSVRRLAGRGVPPQLSWMRPHTLEQLGRAWRRDSADEPARWSTRVAWYSRRRTHRLTLRSFAALGADLDVLPVHPLADPPFLAAIARAGRRTGYASRTEAMHAIFGNLLPGGVVSRGTKASMDEPFWHRHTRAFVNEWHGEGADEDLVDPEALREEWLKPTPDARSSSLLQAAWLAARALTADERSEPTTRVAGSE